MLRFVSRVFAPLAALMSLPQAAHAANFGFVRWPAYLDMPILVSAVMTGIFCILVKTHLPKGAKDYVSVPKEDRTFTLTASVIALMASFVLCMGMVFLGMGLQRAAEW